MTSSPPSTTGFPKGFTMKSVYLVTGPGLSVLTLAEDEMDAKLLVCGSCSMAYGEMLDAIDVKETLEDLFNGMMILQGR